MYSDPKKATYKLQVFHYIIAEVLLVTFSFKGFLKAWNGQSAGVGVTAVVLARSRRSELPGDRNLLAFLFIYMAVGLQKNAIRKLHIKSFLMDHLIDPNSWAVNAMSLITLEPQKNYMTLQIGWWLNKNGYSPN